QLGLNVDRLRDDLRARAALEVKGYLLLEAIADKEGIEATEEDLEKHYAKLAGELNQPVEKLRQAFRKQDSVESLKGRLRQDKAINLYINSPGGSVTAGLAIYDTMQYVKPPVSTICMGQAASMGALLLAAGAKGRRLSLPHSRIMIHQPSGGFGGQASDIELHAKEILRLKAKLNEILMKHTGQALDRIEKDTDRDYFMGAGEAKEYGLIDEVVLKKPASQ